MAKRSDKSKKTNEDEGISSSEVTYIVPPYLFPDIDINNLVDDVIQKVKPKWELYNFLSLPDESDPLRKTRLANNEGDFKLVFERALASYFGSKEVDSQFTADFREKLIVKTSTLIDNHEKATETDKDLNSDAIHSAYSFRSFLNNASIVSPNGYKNVFSSQFHIDKTEEILKGSSILNQDDSLKPRKQSSLFGIIIGLFDNDFFSTQDLKEILKAFSLRVKSDLKYPINKRGKAYNSAYKIVSSLLKK